MKTTKKIKDVLEELTKNVSRTLNFLREAYELEDEKKWELLLEVVGIIYAGMVEALKLMETVSEGVERVTSRIDEVVDLMNRTNDRIDATVRLMEKIDELMRKMELLTPPEKKEHLL